MELRVRTVSQSQNEIETDVPKVITLLEKYFQARRDNSRRTGRFIDGEHSRFSHEFNVPPPCNRLEFLVRSDDDTRKRGLNRALTPRGIKLEYTQSEM